MWVVNMFRVKLNHTLKWSQLPESHAISWVLQRTQKGPHLQDAFDLIVIRGYGEKQTRDTCTKWLEYISFKNNLLRIDSQELFFIVILAVVLIKSRRDSTIGLSVAHFTVMKHSVYLPH